MVLTSCPKCRHQFAPPLPTLSPLSPCPCYCRGAPLVAAAAPVASSQQPPAMLSLSITATSAMSLNGGHVVINTPAPTQRISVTATLPAWGWSPQPPPPAPWCAPAPPRPLADLCPLKGAQLRLTGGRILDSSVQPVLLQPRGKVGLVSGGAEQSPSAPLSFVLPPHAPPPAAPAEGSPEADLRLLQATTQALKQSGWYYEGFSWQESAATLRSAPPGTFLVRDSSDPRFLFSLSVQTDRGPTSVRLLYTAGGFRLDAEPHLAPAMPLFPCVLQLIEHYVANRGGRGKPAPGSTPGSAPGAAPGRGREQVWVDARGVMYSHILLTVPRRHTVPGLQHLARLAVNRQLRLSADSGAERLAKLELPSTLRRFVEEYPYTL